jgi:hypothetical protein
MIAYKPNQNVAKFHYAKTIIIIIIIIIIIFLQGLGQRPVPVQSLTSELLNLFGKLVGLLGRVLSPTQGL